MNYISCFLFICLALCDETSTKVCLYSTNLPDACKNILSFDISKIDDIDSQIESVKANRMILLFAPQINYKLKISTFSEININFTSASQNKEKFNLDLSIDQIESTNSIVLFEDCSLNFVGVLDFSLIHFDWIEFSRCDLSFTNIENKITAQAAVFDSVYKSFSEIKIEGGHRNPDFTINTEDSLSIELKEYENIINKNIHVIYTNPDYRDIEIIGSKQISFLCSTDNINSISTVSMKNIENLEIIDTSIEFPEEYYMKCEDIHNIHADETTLPVSLFKSQTSNEFTNIYVSHYVDISGDIECNVAFHKDPSFEDYYDRISVNVRGSVSSNIISLNSSCIDLEIFDLNIEMNKYVGSDPIIHCIGKGGVSSVTAFTNYAGIVGFNRPLFNKDFDTFLSDDDLTDVLDVELNYLMLSSNSNEFESYGEPSLTFTDDSFIHGFAKDDSVVDIFRTTINPLVDTIIISSPSSKPLKLCYNNDCKGGINVGNDDLKDLSKKFVVEGMKNVVIESSKEIDLIDFSKLFENLNISVESTSNDNVQINSMTFSENLLINCTFKKIKLPSFSIKLTNVTFSECSFISDDKKITTSEKTNVQIDSDFLINNYLVTHFDNNCNINHLAIQIDSFDEIHFNDSGFRFVGSKGEYSISQTTIKWTTIEFKEDSFKSNSLTLFANSNNPSFNLSIQTSKKSDVVFSLKLKDWSQIKEKKLIGVDHFLIPLRVVMTEPMYIDPIVLSGKGKVTYSHEYSSSTSICACENTGQIGSFPNCQKCEKKVVFSDLNNELKSTKYDDLTVIIAGSSKDDNKHPTIDLESINMKIVNFTAENENDSNGYLTISNEKQLNDPQLSETYFDNFEISAKSGTQSNEYVFGDLSFMSTSLTGFDKSTVKINYFTCDTNILSSLNEIYITDNLIISGDFDLFEKTIHFVNDENSEDLKAYISKNTNVKMGEGKVTIGKLNFLIEKSDNFDIVLNIGSKTNITFECEKDAKLNLIPPIQVNRCNNVVFDFTSNSFSWPSGLNDGDFLINFVELTDATLILGHENTPIKIESLSGDSKFIAKSSKVGIISQIIGAESTTTTLMFEKLTNDKCEIEFYELILSSDITISLLQSNIFLLLNSLSNIDGSDTDIDRMIKPQFCLGFDGYSHMQIKFIDNNIKISPTISALLNIPNTVQLDSSELNVFCSKNYTLIKIPVDLSFEFSLDIIDPTPKVHGLTEEAFSVEQDKITNSIIFFTKVHPRNVPFLICYNAKYTCEATVTDDQLIDISSFIPRGLKAVEFRVGKDINNNGLYINFDLSIFDAINAEIRGETTNSVNVHLGQNRIETLTIDGVSLTDTSTNGFKVKKLVVVGSLIDTVQGFSEINITDYPSWMMKRFDSFNGQICFSSISSEILFESDGWTVADEKITASKFPNLKINFQPTDQKLAFKKSTNDRVPALKIKVDSSIKNFIVSKSWSNAKFTNGDGLTVEGITDESSFTVLTSSFPFPLYPLNISQSETQIVKFEKDIEISNDQISLKKSNLNIDNSNEVVKISSVELAEDSVIKNTSPLNIGCLTTVNGNYSKISYATITEKLVIKGESAIEGQIEFDQSSEIQFLWDVEETPEIFFTEFPQTVVDVSLIFSRETITKDQISLYNFFLYQKAFRLANFGPNCRLYNEKLKFVSSYKYFTGENNVFDSFCDDGELIIQGKRLIPYNDDDDGGDDDDDGNNGKKNKKAVIISLSIIIPLIAIGIIVAAVFIHKKGRCKKLELQSELLNPNGEPGSVDITPHYTENI